MGFERLRTYRFRNLRSGTVELSSAKVFLVGENGQGKTNLLEALYVAAYGNSFRTARDRDLVTFGSDEMALDVGVSVPEGTMQVSIRIRDGAKDIRIDDAPIEDRKDLVRTMPVIVFRHADMEFVSGAPDMHRFFLDQTAVMENPDYLDDLRRYRRILKQRNAAIKEEQRALLDVYDPQLAESGVRIVSHRARIMAQFRQVFLDLYREMFGEPLSIEYRPSWDTDSESDVVATLSSRRDTDERMGTTTSGPHRDRLRYRFHDKDFERIASTGQLRTTALILRVAQATHVLRTIGRKPVLLLDDVLLELDPGRRKRFLELLPETDQQVFTFLPGEPIDGYRDDETLVYSVRDGNIEPESSA